MRKYTKMRLLIFITVHKNFLFITFWGDFFFIFFNRVKISITYCIFLYPNRICEKKNLPHNLHFLQTLKPNVHKHIKIWIWIPFCNHFRPLCLHFFQKGQNCCISLYSVQCHFESGSSFQKKTKRHNTVVCIPVMWKYNKRKKNWQLQEFSLNYVKKVPNYLFVKFLGKI